MSINSLANAAAARHRDLAPFPNRAPKNYREIAQASSTPPTKPLLGFQDGQQRTLTMPKDGILEASSDIPKDGQQRISPAPTDTAFNVLFGYIPTEVITLYVAVIAVLPQDENLTFASWITFWFFLLATPVIFLLGYACYFFTWLRLLFFYLSTQGS